MSSQHASQNIHTYTIAFSDQSRPESVVRRPTSMMADTGLTTGFPFILRHPIPIATTYPTISRTIAFDSDGRGEPENVVEVQLHPFQHTQLQSCIPGKATLAMRTQTLVPHQPTLPLHQSERAANSEQEICLLEEIHPPVFETAMVFHIAQADSLATTHRQYHPPQCTINTSCVTCREIKHSDTQQ